MTKQKDAEAFYSAWAQIERGIPRNWPFVKPAKAMWESALRYRDSQTHELIEAALNMVDVKGRHHSEIAMARLIEAAKKYREQS